MKIQHEKKRQKQKHKREKRREQEIDLRDRQSEHYGAHATDNEASLGQAEGEFE